MAAAPAAPAELCAYDAQITPAELRHEGFGVPPSHFKYRSREFFKINGEFFDIMPFKKFTPEKYFKEDSGVAFQSYASNPKKLQPTTAIEEMTRISGLGLVECSVLKETPFEVFCARGDHDADEDKWVSNLSLIHI